MKKLIFIFLSLTTALLFVFKSTYYDNNFKTLKDVDMHNACIVYSKNKVLGLENYSNTIKNGTKIFAYKTKLLQKDFQNDLADYVEFFTSNSCFKTFVDCLNVKILYREQIDNKLIFYCYTNFFKKIVFVKSYKINLQIVFLENEIKVGYPMIYTSF